MCGTIICNCFESKGRSRHRLPFYNLLRMTNREKILNLMFSRSKENISLALELNRGLKVFPEIIKITRPNHRYLHNKYSVVMDFFLHFLNLSTDEFIQFRKSKNILENFIHKNFTVYCLEKTDLLKLKFNSNVRRVIRGRLKNSSWSMFTSEFHKYLKKEI